MGALASKLDSCTDEELKYMADALEAWCYWAHDVGPQQPVSFGKLFGIGGKDLSNLHLLNLSEDQFVAIDRAIAALAVRMQMVIDGEYRIGGSQEQKARRLLLSRADYQQLYFDTLSTLYRSLQPGIDTWWEYVR